MNYVEPWVEDAEELDENRPGPIVDELPPSLTSLADWPEPSKPRSLEVEDGDDTMGPVEENDDYSSWIDNPEFKEADTVNSKTEQ